MSGIPDGHRPIQPHYILRTAAGLLATFLCSAALAAPTAYVDEAEFHDALALMGYTATHEGFEDDAAWGSVRSSIVDGFHSAPSISNLGMTWTSNFLAGGITTGEGPVRSGVYGFYSYLHGSYYTPDPGTDCSVPGECGDGWRGTPDDGVFIAMGGYVDTNTPYAKLGMFIGQYPDNPIDFGGICDEFGENCVPNSTIGTAKEFFGVIDPDGFSAFEYRELEGKTEPPSGGDLKYIFADDFYFVIALPPAPAVLVNPVGGLVTTENGGSASFDVALSTAPTADVTIALTSSNSNEGTVSPVELVFTAADWSNAQSVTVTGVDDALADGNVAYTISVAVSASADPAYSGLAPIAVAVNNVDDETACCEIVYVDQAAAGANDGSSWLDAYTDLQDALGTIGSGEIWVAAGSYKPGANRADTFQLRNNVELYGGFAGTETDRGQGDPTANITTLNGDLLDDDYYRFVNGHVAWGDAADNSHHIVTGSNTDATAVLDGFVLAHGYARGAGPDPGPSVKGGGGLIIQNGSPAISNVIIDGSSGWYGGGAYVHDGSPSFTGCEFRENYADIGRAGAIYIGGASSVTFNYTRFEGNAAIGTMSPDGAGGAAYVDFGSTANFTGSTFNRNLTGYRTNDEGGSSATKGGAIMAGGDVFVRDSRFFANKSHYGGAIYAFNGLTLIDNIFDGNEATSAPTSPSSGGLGGALMLSDLSTLVGNTITANDGSENAGGIYITGGGDVLLVNNVLWGNTVSKFIEPGEDPIPLSRKQLHNGGGTYDMSYGLFEGLYEEIPGEDPPDPTDFPGVLDLDPLFVDPDGADGVPGNEDDDLRPAPGSPAIDSGDNSAVPPDVLTDIAGDQRFQDDPATPDTGLGAAPIVDMGAFEFGGTTPVNQPPVAMPSATPTSGDAPLDVQFESAGSYDPDGVIVSYAWIFGDGGSDSAAAPSYVYATAGNYTAWLTVTDDDGDTHSDSVGVTVIEPVPNLPPVAVHSAIPTSGTAPLNVNFDGSASYDGDGTIVSWDWDFGDGNSDSGPSTSHTYTVAGDYTAWLTVTDDDGATASEEELITVSAPVNNAPTVTIDAPADGSDFEVGANINFLGTASDAEDGDISANISWTSSIDGAIGSGASFSTSSLSAGTHTISADVTDSGGLPGQDQISVTITTVAATTFRVASITTGTLDASKGKKHGTATVTFIDDLGQPVGSDYLVTGDFSGSINESETTDTTDGSGVADFVTNGTAKNVSVSFCVSGVSGGSLTYSPLGNPSGTTCATPPPPPEPGDKVHVQSVTTATQGIGGGRKVGVATIRLEDENHLPVAGHTVTGDFSGGISQSGVTSASTDANGTVTVQSTVSAKGKFSVSFCVSNVSGALGYESGANASGTSCLP